MYLLILHKPTDFPIVGDIHQIFIVCADIRPGSWVDDFSFLRSDS